MSDSVSTNEYLRSLSRGFPTRFSDEYIQVDGWSTPYIRTCTEWLLEQGYISYDKAKSEDQSDEQYTALCYRLTEAGRAILVTKHNEGIL